MTGVVQGTPGERRRADLCDAAVFWGTHGSSAECGCLGLGESQPEVRQVPWAGDCRLLPKGGLSLSAVGSELGSAPVDESGGRSACSPEEGTGC